MPISNDNVFTEMLNITQVLVGYEMNVDRITFSSNGKINLFISNIDVYLGDASEINGKITVLKDMWSKIKDLSGTLYLDNYNPLNENTTYIFKKK